MGKWQQIQAYECCNPTTHLTFTMCSIVGRDGDFRILAIPSALTDTNIVLLLTVTDDLLQDYIITVTILSGISTGISVAEPFVGLASTVDSVVITSISPSTSVNQTYETPGTFTGDCTPV